MTKARTLGNFVSTGNPLSDGSIAASEVTGLATVATSGSYDDLSNKPTITTTATNIAGGSNGTIPYQSAAGTTQMLAVGTAGQLLQTNGAGAPTWVTPSGGFSTMVVLTSGTTWSVPSGKTLAKVTIVGGGGGGGGGVSQGSGGGGGGGGTSVSYVVLTTGSATYAIGARGVGGEANFVGTAGGTTTFAYGAYSLSAGGGTGGQTGGGGQGGAGGTSSGGTLNLRGNGAGCGINHGGLGFGCPPGEGGGSSLGGGGQSATDTAGAYGGGGSGGGINGAGRDGFAGVIIIEY